MHASRQQLVRLALAIMFGCLTLSAHAALIFDRLGQRYTIEVVRHGQIITKVAVPPDARLQVNAESVSTDVPDKTATFRGKVTATVKFADEILFVVSAEEIRVMTGF